MGEEINLFHETYLLGQIIGRDFHREKQRIDRIDDTEYLFQSEDFFQYISRLLFGSFHHPLVLEDLDGQ